MFKRYCGKFKFIISTGFRHKHARYTFYKYEVVWYKRFLSMDWDSANRLSEREYNGFRISVKNYTELFFFRFECEPGP